MTGQSEHAYNSGPGAHGGSQRKQASVVSRFSFLSTAQADLLNEILARRSSTLLERVRQANSVSRSDAEEIMSVISNEVTENLDDKWEPTDYGQAFSAVLAQQLCTRQRVALSVVAAGGMVSKTPALG